MSINLQPVTVVNDITKAQFLKDFYKPQQPVVIKNLTNSWPAYTKWNFDYISKIAGDLTVPLYDDRPVSHKDKFNEAHANMLMRDYISLLQKGPTNYRIFLWNLLKKVPELQEDYSYPDIGLRLLKKMPMLFFGGENAFTFMHYDIDLANILHFHFQGKKKCILFSPDQTPFLYKIPYSLITREDIDFDNPDIEKWPALASAKGMVAYLEHGDTLYMPEGWWHYMKYVTPGFSMSLRALPAKPKHLAKALNNILIMRTIDNLIRKVNGKNWIEWKNKRAIVNTERVINKN
ncbi:MAG: cupin [Flavobacteriales bacterium]|nr:MAG: cupin [Flavobacteriales bacterium]